MNQENVEHVSQIGFVEYTVWPHCPWGDGFDRGDIEQCAAHILRPNVVLSSTDVVALV
jgi:hypothetical protein